MNYNLLDKQEYNQYPIVNIEDNNNGLPFFITKKSDLNSEKHRHSFVQIIYVAKGSCSHIINNNEFKIYKGDIFIMPPYVPHFFKDFEDVKIYEFEFVPEFLNEKFANGISDQSFLDFAYLEPFLVIENMIKPRLNLYGTRQREVEKILDDILFEYDNHMENFEQMIKALTLKLLVLVTRSYTKENHKEKNDDNYLFMKHKEALVRAIDFIDDNYTKDLSLDDVVSVSLLSKSYFGYLFKHMTHKTFTEYMNNLRISKSIELLKERPELKIIDICFEVGYNNVNHFNRIFRSITGTTPMKIRKNNV